MKLVLLPVKLFWVAVRLVVLPFEIALKILVGRRKRRLLGATLATGAVVATAAALSSGPRQP